MRKLTGQNEANQGSGFGAEPTTAEPGLHKSHHYGAVLKYLSEYYQPEIQYSTMLQTPSRKEADGTYVREEGPKYSREPQPSEGNVKYQIEIDWDDEKPKEAPKPSNSDTQYSMRDPSLANGPRPAYGTTRMAEITRAIQDADESFTEMLLRKIDEAGLKDSDCYRKANIDRRYFSKLRTDKYYKPRKSVVLAFAVALELSMEETEELLRKAGYAFSHSYKSDVIVEYFIKNGIYDIWEINSTLLEFDQQMLGG